MSKSNIESWRFERDAPVDTDRYTVVGSPVKFAVLDFVDDRGAIDYRDLAGHLEMPPAYAADRLLTYTRSGLLERDRGAADERSVFRLTDHGRKRLAHFLELTISARGGP